MRLGIGQNFFYLWKKATFKAKRGSNFGFLESFAVQNSPRSVSPGITRPVNGNSQNPTRDLGRPCSCRRLCSGPSAAILHWSTCTGLSCGLVLRDFYGQLVLAAVSSSRVTWANRPSFASESSSAAVLSASLTVQCNCPQNTRRSLKTRAALTSRRRLTHRRMSADPDIERIVSEFADLLRRRLYQQRDMYSAALAAQAATITADLERIRRTLPTTVEPFPEVSDTTTQLNKL